MSPCLGRPFLEAHGLNTRSILAGTAEKHTGAVYVSTLFGTNPEVAQDGRISRVLEGVCHADCGADDAALDDIDCWLDLDPEDRAEKEIVLKQKLSEVRAKGISDNGATPLDELLREYEGAINLKLDVGEPADIEPLRVRPNHGAIPVRADQRRYAAPKREFMTLCVRELLKLGFIKKATSPEWVSSRLIFPIRPPAMCRLTIEHRLVNCSTDPALLPMPNIEAEVSASEVRRLSPALNFALATGNYPSPRKPTSVRLYDA